MNPIKRGGKKDAQEEKKLIEDIDSLIQKVEDYSRELEKVIENMDKIKKLAENEYIRKVRAFIFIYNVLKAADKCLESNDIVKLEQLEKKVGKKFAEAVNEFDKSSIEEFKELKNLKEYIPKIADIIKNLKEDIEELSKILNIEAKKDEDLYEYVKNLVSNLYNKIEELEKRYKNISNGIKNLHEKFNSSTRLPTSGHVYYIR